jgi:hypothetical protein
VEEPTAGEPLQSAFSAIWAPSICVRVPFQRLLIVWPEGSVQWAIQPGIGTVPVLATVTSAW